MAPLQRVTVALTGFPGGPGVSTYYALAGDLLAPMLHDYYAAIASCFPSQFISTVQSSGDIINDADGVITGAWVGPTEAPVPGTTTGAFAGPAGATVSWLTSTILDGRRLKGRTFHVPLSSAAYDTDGSLATSVYSLLVQQSDLFVAAAVGNLMVWHRPKVVGGVQVRPGSSAAVTGSHVPDQVAVLRSRRL